MMTVAGHAPWPGPAKTEAQAQARSMCELADDLSDLTIWRGDSWQAVHDARQVEADAWEEADNEDNAILARRQAAEALEEVTQRRGGA